MITALILLVLFLAYRISRLKRAARINRSASAKMMDAYFETVEQNAELQVRLDHTLKLAMQIAHEKGVMQSDKQWAESMARMHKDKWEMAEAKFENLFYTLSEQ